MTNPDLARHRLIPMFDAVGWGHQNWVADFEIYDVDERCFIEKRVFWPDKIVPQQHYSVFLGRGSYMLAGGLLGPKTMIGRYCSISKSTFIGVRNHPIHHLSTGTTPKMQKLADPFEDKNDLSDLSAIGHDVWIGANAVVLAGVKIGHGCVIGAGSVVTRDVAPYQIVAGNPARILKPRFEERIAQGLLESEWWYLPESEIQKLPQDNIEACLDIFQDLKKDQT